MYIIIGYTEYCKYRLPELSDTVLLLIIRKIQKIVKKYRIVLQNKTVLQNEVYQEIITIII